MRLRLLSLLVLSLFVTACGGGDDENNFFQNISNAVAPTVARGNVQFDPRNSTLSFPLPLPTDLARNDATGLNEIPGSGEPFESMNSISGWSTSGPIFVPFTRSVRRSSVNNQSIVVVDLVDGVQPCTFEFGQGDAGEESLVILTPVKPLKPNRQILVIVTDRVVDNDGLGISDSIAIRFLKSTQPLVEGQLLSAEEAAALEPVRQEYQPLWARAESFLGRDRDDIPFVFSFTTQDVGGTLASLRSRVQAESPSPTEDQAFVGETEVTDFMNGNPIGQQVIAQQPDFPQVVGAIRYGTIPCTQYLANAGTINERPFTPDLLAQGTLNIQYLMCQPNEAMFPGPRPAVVFQHGFTRNKDDMLALAHEVCGRGFVLIGIDAVRHGAQTEAGLNPDAYPGDSGTGFLNLENLRLFRDYLRQTIVNQLTLVRAITSGQFPQLTAAQPPYVGNSLGSILGGITLGVEPSLGKGVLNVGGGRWTLIAQNSDNLSPAVVEALANQGLPQGSPGFRQFFWIAQTVLDDADPINYADAAIEGHAILLQEMIDDLVVPNSATRDLALAMTLPHVSAKETFLVSAPGFGDFVLPQVTAPVSGSGFYQEQGGQHGFLLDTSQGGTDGNLTFHAQDQVAGFLFDDTIIPRGRSRGVGIRMPTDYTRLLKGP